MTARLYPHIGRMPTGQPTRTELRPLEIEFLEWLVDPTRQGTIASWARDHDLHPQTPHDWKKHPTFKAAWEKRLKELNIAPDRVQRVLDALWDKACTGDSKAASLYLQYIERFTPKTTVVVHDRAVADLSDAELAEFLGGGKDGQGTERFPHSASS